MHVPSAVELLDAWESAHDRSPVERALRLLHATAPEVDPAALAHIGIGRRTSRLLALRTALFGPTFVGLATCPACGERVEATFSSTGLAGAATEDPPPPLELDGWRVECRVPDSADLASAARHGDADAARRELLARCIVHAARADGSGDPAQLPAPVVAAVLDRLATADPAGDVELAVECPACDHRWDVDLDVETFLWDELGAWSTQLLHDVHVLASAYGWAEADILCLGAWRRRTYVALAMS